MPSKTKKQSRFMSAVCKSPEFRKKVKVSKKVACEFHKADAGKFHESEQLNELKEYIDPEGHYGGWISPDREVFYVENYQHEIWIQDNHGIRGYGPAFRLNWVRFETNSYPESFSVMGNKEGIKHALPIFWPTALKTDKFFIDIKDNTYYKSAAFKMPDDKLIARNFCITGELKKLEQSNELNETADTSKYGGWISPKGKIYYVDFMKHDDWAREHLYKVYDRYVEDPYILMFKRGWIRYISQKQFQPKSKYENYNDFWIEGKQKDLNRLAKIWIPMLKGYDKVIMDVFKTRSMSISRSYELPKDKNRMRKDLIESMTQEEIIKQKTKTFLDSLLTGAKKRTGLNNSKYNVSVYKHEAIAEEKDGRIVWTENVIPIYTKKNISYKNAMKCEARFEAKTNELNEQDSESSGWSDYFVRVEENKINESMGGASTFMRIGRHLVEMQPEWVEENGSKHPKWEIFVDGRGIGAVEQFSSGFAIEGSDETADNVEEAIAKLMKEKVKKMMVGKKSRREADQEYHATNRRNEIGI